MRSLEDPNLQVETAFPAANANNNSASIDLGAPQGSRREGVELFIRLPENSILAAGQTITASIEDSADNSNWAAAPVLGSVAVTGKVGNGLPDTDGNGFEVAGNGDVVIHFPCPRKLDRYVRADIIMSSTTGNLTSLSYIFGVVV